jgi:hypothetical protein
MTEDAAAQNIIKDLPQRFISATMSVLADTTMEFIRQDPEQAEIYRNAGFEMLWAGIARKR